MPFSTVFQLYHGSQYTYPSFPGVLLTSSQHNILSKPLAVFPHNHCRNNEQGLERNESCCSDYHQSPEIILAQPGMEPGLVYVISVLYQSRVLDKLLVCLFWNRKYAIKLNLNHTKYTEVSCTGNTYIPVHPISVSIVHVCYKRECHLDHMKQAHINFKLTLAQHAQGQFLSWSFVRCPSCIINNFYKHLLLPNHWANLDQTWEECSLAGHL